MPSLYRIIMNLLKMNVSPIAIVQMLKSMVNPRANITASSVSTVSSAGSDITGSSVQGHSGAKRSSSASSVAGGSSTSRSLKSGSKSGTSVRSDSSGKSRSTKTNPRTWPLTSHFSLKLLYDQPKGVLSCFHGEHTVTCLWLTIGLIHKQLLLRSLRWSLLNPYPMQCKVLKFL